MRGLLWRGRSGARAPGARRARAGAGAHGSGPRRACGIVHTDAEQAARRRPRAAGRAGRRRRRRPRPGRRGPAPGPRPRRPWGDVFVSHRIATRGGHPLAKVFAARRTGASWKEIAEEAGVDAALLARDLAAAFPGLTPAAPRPVTAPPPGAAPPAPPAPAPEKKPGPAQRFLDLFRGTPAREAT